MKRIVYLLLAALLCLPLTVSCDTSPNEDESTETAPPADDSTPEIDESGATVIEIGGTTQTPCIVKTEFPTSDMVVADIVVTDKKYGADPTGQKDSSQAIRDALSDCEKLGGGTVWIPSGTYKIASTLKIPSMVTLRGDYADPDTVTDGNYGTVFMIVFGSKTSTAIRMAECSGIRGITIFYTKQTADNPQNLGWAIELRGNEGGQSLSIEDITLLNAWDGIGLSPDGYGIYSNSNLYLNNIKGTVLNRGLVANNNAGASSYERISFGNQYWANATEAYNAPSKSTLDAYTRKNAVAFVLGDLEMPLIYKLSASQFRYGIQLVAGKRMNFWGAGMSFLDITETDIALKVDAMEAGRMAGIVRSTLMGSKASIEMNCSGSTLLLTDCNLSHPPKGGGVVTRYPQTTPSVYEESDTVLKPAKAVLYNVIKEPYNAPYAKINKNDKLGSDCTSAIQAALNDAGNNGGGIVYLPAGHYVIKGNLTIPAGVELRGAGSSPWAPGPSGGTMVFLYAGKGTKSATTDTAGITVVGNGGGIRQIQILYPENPFASKGSIIAYPYAIRFQNAENSYCVNSELCNPYLGIDIAEGSHNSYIRGISGTAGNGFIHVGKANGCHVETLHDINPGYWCSATRYGEKTPWMTDIFAYFFEYQRANCNTITVEGAEELRILNVLQFGGRCALEVTGGSVEAWSLLLDQGGLCCIKVNSGSVISMNSELTGHGKTINSGNVTAYNECYIK